MLSRFKAALRRRVNRLFRRRNRVKQPVPDTSSFNANDNVRMNGTAAGIPESGHGGTTKASKGSCIQEPRAPNRDSNIHSGGHDPSAFNVNAQNVPEHQSIQELSAEPARAIPSAEAEPLCMSEVGAPNANDGSLAISLHDPEVPEVTAIKCLVSVQEECQQNITTDGSRSAASQTSDVTNDDQRHYELSSHLSDKKHGVYGETAEMTGVIQRRPGQTSTDLDADVGYVKNHTTVDFDHTTHTRPTVVQEEIKPHVHTIYEPRRTRSIHFHEHRTLIQPIIDPNPTILPAQHWSQDPTTGELFKIPDELGRQLMEQSGA